MSYNNGVITAPIRIDANGGDFANIGITSGDVRTICTSALINKWSVRKPIYWPTQTKPKVEPLTDEEMQSQNYGLVIDFGEVRYAAEVVRLSADGADFRYIDRNAPYRLSDFDGYDHNQESWFGVDLHQQTIVRGSVIPVSFKYENVGLDLDFFSQMEFYGGGNQHDWCVGFIMNPTSAWTTGTRTCWVCICGRIDEVLSDDKFRLRTSKDMNADDYYAMPVIFSASSVDASRLNPDGEKCFQQSMNDILSGEWRYMPCNLAGQTHPVMVTLTAQPTPPTPTTVVEMVVGEVIYSFVGDRTIRITSSPITLVTEQPHTFDVTFTIRNVTLSRTNLASGTQIDLGPMDIDTYPLLPEDTNVNLDAVIVIRETGERETKSVRIIEA